MSEEIAIARQVIRQSFEEDPGFFDTYISNVGLLLYDYYNKADFSDYELREEAAKHILKKIFWD